MTPSRRLDVIGLFCPLPILLAMREMKHMNTGDCLEILGDDPGILEDMPVWCDKVGHRLLEIVELDDRVIRSLIEKGPPRPPAGPARRIAKGKSPGKGSKGDKGKRAGKGGKDEKDGKDGKDDNEGKVGKEGKEAKGDKRGKGDNRGMGKKKDAGRA